MQKLDRPKNVLVLLAREPLAKALEAPHWPAHARAAYRPKMWRDTGTETPNFSGDAREGCIVTPGNLGGAGTRYQARNNGRNDGTEERRNEGMTVTPDQTKLEATAHTDAGGCRRGCSAW